MNNATFYETVLISELCSAPQERQVCFVGALSRFGSSGEGLLTLRDGSGTADTVCIDTRDVDVPSCAPLTLLRVHGLTRGCDSESSFPVVRATVLVAVEALDLASWRSALLLRRAVLMRQGLLDFDSLGHIASTFSMPTAAAIAVVEHRAAASRRRTFDDPAWAMPPDSQESSQQLSSSAALVPTPFLRRKPLPPDGEPPRSSSGDTVPAEDT